MRILELESLFFTLHTLFQSYRNDSLQKGVNQQRKRFYYKWDSTQGDKWREFLGSKWRDKPRQDKPRLDGFRKDGSGRENRIDKYEWQLLLKDLYKTSRMWGHFSKATKHMKMRKYLKKEKQGNVIIVYKIAWKKCLHGHNNVNLNIDSSPTW